MLEITEQKKRELIIIAFDSLSEFFGWEIEENIDIFNSENPRIITFRNLSEKLVDAIIDAVKT